MRTLYALMLRLVVVAGEAETSVPAAQSGWLVELYNRSRIGYAAGSVVLLLAAGALLGLVTEALLSFLGWGTDRIERVE